jgi:hypothetical protein
MFDRYDFFEKFYFHELGQRQWLLGSVSVPIGLIGVVAGAIGYLAVQFRFGGETYQWSSGVEWTFVISLLAAVFFLIVSSYFTARLLIDDGYKYMAATDSWQAYHDRLVQWYRDQGKSEDDANKLADKDLAKAAQVEFAQNASNNLLTNGRQGRRFLLANAYVATASAALAIALASYYVDFIEDPPKKEVQTQLENSYERQAGPEIEASQAGRDTAP